MYFAVNLEGRFWTGFGWAEQGKPFLSVSAATRSLCEEGEDLENVSILEAINDSATVCSAGSFTVN